MLTSLPMISLLFFIRVEESEPEDRMVQSC